MNTLASRATRTSLSKKTSRLKVTSRSSCGTHRSHQQKKDAEASFFCWCEKRDLNPYGVNHTPLKRARLPVPPLSRLPSLLRRLPYYTPFILVCQYFFESFFDIFLLFLFCPKRCKKTRLRLWICSK